MKSIDQKEKQAMGHSEGNALPILTIRRWSRLQNSFHHALASGFFLLEILPQRLLDLRQPVFADRVSLHRLPSLHLALPFRSDRVIALCATDQPGDPLLARKGGVADRPARLVNNEKEPVGFRDLFHGLTSRSLAA